MKTSDGLLTLKPTTFTSDSIFVIPKGHKIIEKIISEYHTQPNLAAHTGCNKTLQCIKRRFYWQNMSRDVEQFIRGCIPCQKRDVNAFTYTKEPLGTSEIPTRPGEIWSIDVLGRLPITANGNCYVLVCSDKFSKWKICEPCQSQDAETISDIIIRRLIAVHGPPDMITCENGTYFLSRTFTEMAKRFTIKMKTCAPYHHQSNGQAEREIRSLEKLLSAYVNKTQTDWDDFVHLLSFALNSCPNTTTNLSPFFVLYGREPRIPDDLPRSHTKFATADEYIDTLHMQLNEIWDYLREYLPTKEKKREEIYNNRNKIKQREIQIGDSILIRRAAPKNKLAPKLIGPFTVTKVTKHNVYFTTNRKDTWAHKNDCRLLQSTRSNDMTNHQDNDEPPHQPAITEEEVPEEYNPEEEDPEEDPLPNTISTGRPHRIKKIPRKLLE